MWGVFNMRLLKVRLLNVSGVEWEIVEENLLKGSVVELKQCWIEVVLNSLLLNTRFFNLRSVECEAQQVLNLSGIETK